MLNSKKDKNNKNMGTFTCFTISCFEKFLLDFISNKLGKNLLYGYTGTDKFITYLASIDNQQPSLEGNLFEGSSTTGILNQSNLA